MALNAVTSFSKRGYGSSPLRSSRDTEYDAFSYVTRLLREAKCATRGPNEIFAVHQNNELWTILAADLATPGNALSDQVKAGLISLAIFSLKHGNLVLAGEATTEALIEINLSIMKGLRGEGSQ